MTPEARVAAYNVLESFAETMSGNVVMLLRDGSASDSEEKKLLTARSCAADLLEFLNDAKREAIKDA